MKQILLGSLLIGFGTLFAQYSPPAGQVGSIAIYKDDTRIKAWATEISVIRGPINALDSSAGVASAGLPESAIGPAGTNGVVSLGDGGTATAEFNGTIYNGGGYDFVVFENSFSDDFLELAFVEVSSDGENFTRFPSISLSDTLIQKDAFGLTDCDKLNNLAGSFRALYGTPFDLNDIRDSSNIDLMNIRFIRIRDVIGSLLDPIVSRDSRGTKINDPFPTEFPSCGFDLDAIGAIHIQLNTGVSSYNEHRDLTIRSIYSHDEFQLLVINQSSERQLLKLLNLNGQICHSFQSEANTSISYPLSISKGMYILSSENGQVKTKIIIP